MNGSKKALYYYLANQETINEGHIGEFVAIYNNQIEGYYPDFWDGVSAMADKKYPPGSFNVTKCLPGDEWAVHTGSLDLEGGLAWPDLD
jgi:hypothetical protein